MSSSLFGIDTVDAALRRDLQEGLDAVEVQLLASTRSDYPFVTETSRHLVNAGGNRIWNATHIGAVECNRERAGYVQLFSR